MRPKELIMKPLELVAGDVYPFADRVARQVTEGGASGSEVDMSIAYEKSQWHGHLVHLDGITRFIRNLRGTEQ